MRIKKAAALMFFLSLFVLAGCSRSSQVENQAYVLVMGMDALDDGGIQISVQVPRISGGGSAGESGGGTSGSYTQLSVSGEDFETALEKLDWAAPRELNLSHLKLIIFSRSLAESSVCRELIENIAQTERLFTSARTVVCEGSAKEFVSALQPVIGTRISTDIDAMFEHYISSGYVPESSFAELFYQTESVYSDPMITYAVLDKSAQEKKGSSGGAKQASALSGTIEEICKDYESEIPTRYLGAAVFAGGQMKGVFSGTQTIIANLLRNDVDSFRYKYDNQSLEIVPARQAFVHVKTDEVPVEIRIDAKLSLSSQERMPDENILRGRLEADIRDTIQAARNMDAEPFGFAERAAKGFLNMDDWLDFNWPDRFKDAKITVDLSFARSDT